MAIVTKSLCLVLSALFILSACGGRPDRPPTLPTAAQWGGTSRKGVFLRVGDHRGTLWQLDIWDRKGQPLGSGSFRLRGFAKADILPEEVVGWENGTLLLKDGTLLVPEPH